MQSKRKQDSALRKQNCKEQYLVEVDATFAKLIGFSEGYKVGVDPADICRA